jgi:hypothetical protein
MLASIRPSRGAAFALVLSALVLGATSARAGTFSNPFTDPGICGSVSVSSSLQPANVFNASIHCASLCKAAGAQCGKYVKRAIACYNVIYATNAVFESKNCVEGNDPVTARICKATVKATLLGVRAALVADRDTGLAGCDTWESACLAACPL